MPQTLEISTKTLLKLLAVIVLFWFLFLIRDILVLLFIAVVLMSALSPMVNHLEKYKIPRGAGTTLVFLLVTLFCGILIYLTLPPLISQTRIFVSQLPDFADTIADLLIFWDKVKAKREITLIAEQIASVLSRELTKTPIGIIKAGKGIVNSIITIFSLLVFTFYLTCEQKKVKSFIVLLIPPKNRDEGRKLIGAVEKKLGAWLRGQFFLSLSVGFTVWITLTALRFPFALPLALIAGILEIIPIIGPFVSMLPAIIIAGTISLFKVFSVIALYWLIQQLENNLLIPKIMAKTVGLDPLAVILALMIGGKLMGPLGTLLAVPVTAALFIIVSALNQKK